METVEPPDADECRRLCREKIARADFLIGLAETPRARLPQNLWRSIATRDPLYLTETAKYLAGSLYQPASTPRPAAPPRAGLWKSPEPAYRSLRLRRRGRVRGVNELATPTDPEPARPADPALALRPRRDPALGEATLHVNTEAVVSGVAPHPAVTLSVRVSDCVAPGAGAAAS